MEGTVQSGISGDRAAEPGGPLLRLTRSQLQTPLAMFNLIELNADEVAMVQKRRGNRIERDDRVITTTASQLRTPLSMLAIAQLNADEVAAVHTRLLSEATR